MRYLPGKDCGNCGHEGCIGFAKALGQGKVDVKRCPEMELRTRDSLKGALPIKLEVHGADSSMITVQETLIAVNSPMVSPPVLITGNCAVTLNMLKLIFDRAPEVSAWIVPTETKGSTHRPCRWHEADDAHERHEGIDELRRLHQGRPP